MTNYPAKAELEGKEVFVVYNDKGLSVQVKQGFVKKNLKEIQFIPILNLINADFKDHMIIIKNKKLDLTISFAESTYINDIHELIKPIYNSIDSFKTIKVKLDNFLEAYVDLLLILRDIKKDPINTAMNFSEDQALKLGINKYNPNEIISRYIELLNAKIDEVNALIIEVDLRIIDKIIEILKNCKQYLKTMIEGLQHIQIDENATRDELYNSFKKDIEKLLALDF
ncbi:MAG: hypothetical protein QXZ12_08475 [Thermoplasmata archaeon]